MPNLNLNDCKDKRKGFNYELPDAKYLRISNAMSKCRTGEEIEAFEEFLENEIKHGFDINYHYNRRTSLLQYAIWLTMPAEMIYLLLRHGADPNIGDIHNESALTQAAKQTRWVLENPKMFQALIKRSDLNHKDRFGTTALAHLCFSYIAFADSPKARTNILAVIKILLDAGANPYLDDYGLSGKAVSLSNTEKDKRKKEIAAYIESYLEQKQTLKDSLSADSVYEYNL